MESFIENLILLYVYFPRPFVLGALMIGLTIVMCVVGKVVFSSLIILFGIIEGTSHVPAGQHRSMRKTVSCVIGLAIATALLRGCLAIGLIVVLSLT